MKDNFESFLFAFLANEVFLQSQGFIFVLRWIFGSELDGSDYILELEYFANIIVVILGFVVNFNSSDAIALDWFHEVKCSIDPPKHNLYMNEYLLVP